MLAGAGGGASGEAGAGDGQAVGAVSASGDAPGGGKPAGGWGLAESGEATPESALASGEEG